MLLTIIYSTYQMLWGAGTGVYGTAGIYCNLLQIHFTNGDIVALQHLEVKR
jgi:hypothetical protein